MELYGHEKTWKTTEDVVAFLREVRAVLEVPGAWSQGAEARTEQGVRADARDADACCFCLTGAVKRVRFLHAGAMDYSTIDVQAMYSLDITRHKRAHSYGDINEHALRNAAMLSGPAMLQSWNDHQGRTCAVVLELIDDTITRLSAKRGLDSMLALKGLVEREHARLIANKRAARASFDLTDDDIRDED